MYGPVSVSELKEYWRSIGRLTEGQSLQGLFQRQMPPWNDLCSELNWELHIVDQRYFARKHHGYWSVYRLIGLESEGDVSKPVTLNRVCGHDTTGTLYIGKSNSLNERLNAIRRTALNNKHSHDAVGMLKSIPKLDFLPNRLAIALLFTEIKPRSVERDLITAYINTFGDTPPLNYSL
jgi:hypothetical protein